MMKSTIDELITYYLLHGKPYLDRKLRQIRSKDASSELILKNRKRSEASILEFLNKEKDIQCSLSHCNNWEDVYALADKAFSGIKGIGEGVINDWVFQQVYKNDLDPEANCISYLYSEPKRIIYSNEITEDQLIQHVRKLNKDFKEFNGLDVANFINYAAKKKRLNEVLPQRKH